jgi:anti-sigma regulatory factor (Ser/Thr protein kinase)
MHSPTRPGPPTLGSLGNLHFIQAFRKEPPSVPLARGRFREAARASKLDSDIVDRGELCLTELTANAVRHALDPRRNPQILTGATVRPISRRLYLEIGVSDFDRHWFPDLPDQATAARKLFELPLETRGRGLLLVASLADEIGYERGPNGKRIWCRWPL